MAKVISEMAGSVLEVKVKVGDRVSPGDELIVVESMKMEVPVVVEVGGEVKVVHVKEGDFVNEGDVIAEVGD